jgi:hypothetical protein
MSAEESPKFDNSPESDGSEVASMEPPEVAKFIVEDHPIKSYVPGKYYELTRYISGFEKFLVKRFGLDDSPEFDPKADPGADKAEVERVLEDGLLNPAKELLRLHYDIPFYYKRKSPYRPDYTFGCEVLATFRPLVSGVAKKESKLEWNGLKSALDRNGVENTLENHKHGPRLSQKLRKLMGKTELPAGCGFSKHMQKVIRQTDNYYARTGIQHYFVYDGNFFIIVDRTDYDKPNGTLPKFTVFSSDKHWRKQNMKRFGGDRACRNPVNSLALFVGLVCRVIDEQHPDIAKRKKN